jgi:hypothetical protein
MREAGMHDKSNLSTWERTGEKRGRRGTHEALIALLDLGIEA